MKKMRTVTLITCLLLFSSVGKAETYLTMAEMCEQAPARWTQTYETTWRTVNIDVQPLVPQVKKVPILKVVPEFGQPDVSVLGAGWTSKARRMGVFNAYLNYADLEENDKVSTTTTTSIYPPFDMNTAYAKGNELILAKVLDQLQLIMNTLGYDRGQWQYDRPNKVMVNTIASNTTGILRPGNYTVSLNQKLYGLPIFCHALSGVEQPKDSEQVITTGLTFRIRTLHAIALSGKQVKVTDVLAEDVPLCSFSTVKAAIEEEIQAGHIRKIFDVELGYALYNEPGTFRTPGNPEFSTAVFYAVPVWRVTCHYIENAKKELRDYTGMDVSERNVIEYKTLIVNAQTGVVMDRTDNHKGCADYAGFLSWEEVRGKQ